MVASTSIAWRVPTWASSNPEEAEEVDEPPETRCHKTSPQQFRRTVVRRPSEQTSLLTKAIMGAPDNDIREEHHSAFNLGRRRSMASNVSVASTADLTSDTGLTSPARTNTPSPPIPEAIVSQLHGVPPQPKPTAHAVETQNTADLKAKPQSELQPTPQDAPHKRSIQFACTARPFTEQGAARAARAKTPSTQEHPRRPSVKFACPTRTSSTQSTPPRQTTAPRLSPKAKKPESPSTPKKSSSIPAGSATPRPAGSFRKLSNTPGARPKFLRANSNDFVNEGSHFHEFACEMSREEDWIRHDSAAAKYKLTINDTLTKENHIRRIGKEAEEEAEMEEEEEGVIDEDDEEDDEEDEDVDDQDEDGDEDEDEDEYEDDDNYSISDGYRTDEETGFASSDESDEGETDMVLWTLSKSPAVRPNLKLPTVRRASLNDHSDSSTTTTSSPRRSKMQRIKPQQNTPDLPDSTDFVCGTLDEDRPLEEAYLSCLAARRNEKLRVIPQDIDPSFPASEPEDEDDEDIYNPVHHDSDDNDFLHGRMEDLHHEQDRSRRRRKNEKASPRRYHSPPPKRHVSPAPKARGRSPKPLFHRQSPRRMRWPAPKAMITPQGSPRQGNHVKFNLAARPGLTMTKSLPRPGMLFGQGKHCRNAKHDQGDDLHLRGAIDIVKGLEKKRQRRKEKFYQKYCNRARRGQIPERKPQPGRGAERMKELGLLMAGKKDQGNYVISI